MDNSFVKIGQEHPCSGCPAPCCITHLDSNKPIRSYMDLDWMRYTLNFPDYEFLFYPSGEITLLRWVNCGNFDSEKTSCKVHNSLAQPRTCFYYNPWNCWYKRNFVTPEAPDIVRVNMARFEVWSGEVELDENRIVSRVPTYERLRAIAQQLPITPVLTMNSNCKSSTAVNMQI